MIVPAIYSKISDVPTSLSKDPNWTYSFDPLSDDTDLGIGKDSTLMKALDAAQDYFNDMCDFDGYSDGRKTASCTVYLIHVPDPKNDDDPLEADAVVEIELGWHRVGFGEY